MANVSSIISKNKQYDIKDTEARNTKLNITDLPTKISFFNNDVNFITNTANDLQNYFSKSETYNKEQIQSLLATKFQMKIVSELPTDDISSSTIYFLKRTQHKIEQSQEQQDVYDEYIYVDATWELIGNTYVDLSNYYIKEETDTQIENAVNVEMERAIESENLLKSNLDDIQVNLQNEITNRQSADITINDSISKLKIDLENETTRATTAENILSDRCDVYDGHLSNSENPHGVTKEQIGLGNVNNISTDLTPTKNSENNVSSGGVYNQLQNKVDKVNGKVLSDQNFTYEEKTKLSNLSNYDDAELNSKVNENTNAITILNADSDTENSVDYKIKNAISDITSLNYEVVAELPDVGKRGIIYFVLNNNSDVNQNKYSEYVYMNNDWEKLGEVVGNVDLSNYYNKASTNALLSVKANKSIYQDKGISMKITYDEFYDENNHIKDDEIRSLANIDIGHDNRIGEFCGVAIGIDNYCYGMNSLTLGYHNNIYRINGTESPDRAENSIAIGFENTVKGPYSTGIGRSNYVEGFYSTAIGKDNRIENGDKSYAEGLGTFSCGECQHVQGKYNIKDVNSKYAHIVGNGSDEGNRSNAYTLDWEGNAYYSGTVKANEPIKNNDLSTKFYVDNNAGRLNTVEEVNTDYIGLVEKIKTDFKSINISNIKTELIETFDEDINVIKKLNDKFFALGNNGYLSISEDGIYWTEITTNIEGNLLDIESDGYKYIIFCDTDEEILDSDGYSTGEIKRLFVSTDSGLTWQKTFEFSSYSDGKIFYFDNAWYLDKDGYVSENGYDWYRNEHLKNYAIAKNDDVMVAGIVMENEAYIFTQPKGTGFFEYQYSLGTIWGFNDLRFNGTCFDLTYSYNYSIYQMHSNDGINWSDAEHHYNNHVYVVSSAINPISKIGFGFVDKTFSAYNGNKWIETNYQLDSIPNTMYYISNNKFIINCNSKLYKFTFDVEYKKEKLFEVNLNNEIQEIITDKSFETNLKKSETITTIKSSIYNEEDIMNLIYPIGCTYMQFPDTSSPNRLFSGTTWEDISTHYAGLFPRIAGGNAEKFNKRLNCSVGGTSVTFTSSNHGVTTSSLLIDPNTWEQRGVTAVGGNTVTIESAFSNSVNITNVLVCQSSQLPNITGHLGSIIPFTSPNKAFFTNENSKSIANGTYFGTSDVSFDASKACSIYTDNGEARPANFTIKIWKRVE